MYTVKGVGGQEKRKVKRDMYQLEGPAHTVEIRHTASKDYPKSLDLAKSWAR